MNHINIGFYNIRLYNLLCLLVFFGGCGHHSDRISENSQVSQSTVTNSTPATPSAAAIASAHPLATQAGIDILAQGGNAFDAAVTVAAVLAVVEPSGSGLGGGGFWLLHRQSDGKQVMLDSRETAPLAAHRNLFLNDNGQVVSGNSLNGALSAGIPGIPAALVYLSKNYGQLPLSTTLAPAIKLANEGFEIDDHLVKMLSLRHQVIMSSPAAASIFLKNGEIPASGTRLIQTDLAKTLSNIVRQGHAGFYKGGIAEKLVASVRKGGGIWSLEDLASYHVIERQPIIGEYRGARIVSASPPSSGGLVLIESLNILNGFPLDQLDSASRKHLIVEAWRRAYRDRALYMGDPDFVSMPIELLLSQEYADALRTTIQIDRATPSQDLTELQTERQQGNNTTHFSVLDKHGNRVAATLSINYPFGSGFVAEGTGVLLNDEMDDFVAAPDSPNVYGLIGGSANSIQPGKRMLSSMTPTFVEMDSRIAILGTPGGSRIITMVCLALLDFVNGNEPVSWVSLPRFHHQFFPDFIQYEPDAFSQSELHVLQQRGHKFRQLKRHYGNMQAILWDQSANTVQAASDPRGIGLSVVK